MENRLSELWNLFDFLMPGYLYSHNRFVEKLERPIIQSEDGQAREQLAKLVRPFLLRRLKQDVLKELPPKMEHVRRIALSDGERKLCTKPLWQRPRGCLHKGRSWPCWRR